MVGYNQIFPQVQPLDIGNTLFKIAALKDQQETREYRNRLLDLQTKEAEQKITDRNALRAALPGALNGDAEASSQVAALSPELWQKLDANRREKIKTDVETTGRLLYAVQQSQDPASAYPAAIEAARARGIDVSKVPAQYDANWVNTRIAEATSLSDQIKLAEGQKPQVVAPGGALVGRNGNVIFQNPDRTQAPVAIPDDKSPTGFRYGTREEALGQPALGPSGLSMEFGPDGKPTRIMSGPGAAKGAGGNGLTPSSQTKVQEQLIEMGGLLAQTAEINRTFDPQNQTAGKRLSMLWAAGKDKLGSATEDDKAALADYTTQRASAGQFFADRLKAMSGTAVTPIEAKKQEVYLPTPGTGIIDGDSPTEFSAKSKRMQDFFQKATARLAYVDKHGLSIADVPLDKMPSIIQRRGDALATEFTKQGLKGDALKSAVKRQLATEFGLVGE